MLHTRALSPPQFQVPPKVGRADIFPLVLVFRVNALPLQQAWELEQQLDDDHHAGHDHKDDDHAPPQVDAAGHSSS